VAHLVSSNLVLISGRQSLPAISEVTAANHSDFQKADKVVAIAYLSSSTDAPAPQFSAAAEAHRDKYLFGLTTDKEAFEAAGVTPPAVIVYRSFDEHRSEYPYPPSALTQAELTGWLEELSVPIFDQVNGENYMVYASSQKPLAYLFIDPASENKDEIIKSIRPIAQKYKPKMNFVWIDAVQFSDHGKALNLHEAKWPAFVIQDLKKQLKFPLDQSEALTPEAVSDFVSRYFEGKLEPTLKSEPVPETQDEPVYVLVGKNFEQAVFDDSKDVFIEFYATW
jgi:protein disulfide-isomerase A1